MSPAFCSHYLSQAGVWHVALTLRSLAYYLVMAWESPVPSLGGSEEQAGKQ